MADPGKDQAQAYLDGKELDEERLRGLVADLKRSFDFHLAARVLRRALRLNPDASWLAQQLALCTYKDEERHPASRHREALAILESIGLRRPDLRDSETLALGGAIYKRMWEHEGQWDHLVQALGLYREAWTRNPQADLGYGGVNAAFILDIMAHRAALLARRAGASEDEAKRLRGEARKLRRDMRARIPELAAARPDAPGSYWLEATLAEVEFGLERYAAAGEHLGAARKAGASEWQLQTTFRQLVTLARLQGKAPPPEDQPGGRWAAPWKALAALLGEGTARALACYRGKVGLALSGGGLRASFYHLGVLARLAEMDVLRSVEVLSTVSGGSIVGALYYLEVQDLLQRHPDAEITREHYVALVQRVQERFLRGTQANLRMRAFASLVSNLRMLCPRFLCRVPYTRSHRLGELYERHLYARVGEHAAPRSAPRHMQELLIRPAGETGAGTFNPRFGNWRRRARVPVLLLNATALNTGHNWHFTAKWMGEPPGLLGDEVDKNERLRRVYYEDAPQPEHRNYRLGHAVAASACVPGLFDPLVIRGLYPGRTVRLVDGGVHDNQGVAGLLSEGCSVILCSDASGQMGDEPDPPDGTLGVPLRANSILMNRVREVEYQDLRGRLDSQALDGLFFVHLKHDLAVPAVGWVGSEDGAEAPPPGAARTAYGVDCELQRRIAAVRTDLDSFTEVEAYTLMLDGYLMTRHRFQALQEAHVRDGLPGTWGGYDVDAPSPGERWSFMALAPLLAAEPAAAGPRRADLELQIRTASRLFLKPWHLVPALRHTAWAALAAAAVVLAWLLFTHWNTTICLGTRSAAQCVGTAPSVGALVLALLAGVAVLFVPVLKLVNPRKAFTNGVWIAIVAVVGGAAVNLHLHTVDRLFRRRGRLARLLALGDR